MRFVMLKGQSQYGSLRLHVDQLAAALRALKHDAVVVDVQAADGSKRLAGALTEPADCLFAFNGVGADLAAGPLAPARMIYASMYLDHPLHHVARLKLAADRRAAFFLDRRHVAFMELWAAPGAFAHIGFLPPGANELDRPAGAADFLERTIPVLFTGTYRGPPDRSWAGWPASQAKDLVAEIADRMMADGRLAVLDALAASLAGRQAPLSHEFVVGAAPLLLAVQQYVEAAQRHAVLTALGDARVPIAVYGAGWENLSARYRSFDHGGVGSFETTLSLLRKTRLVLNINNGFVAGGHERVFTAMAAGAAVLTDESAYYDDVLKGQVATYSLNALSALPDKIRALSADEDGLAAMAAAGQARALAEHRWLHRASELVKALRPIGRGRRTRPVSRKK